MASKQREYSLILQSGEFQRELLASERRRTVGAGTVLALVYLLTWLRAVFEPLAANQMMVRFATPLALGAIGYEGLRFFFIRFLQSRGKPLPSWSAWVNTIFEALFPSLVIWLLTQHPNVGPYRALLTPAVYLYFFVILLATMRLQPAFTFLSGLLCSVGYLGITFYTFAHFPRATEGESIFRFSVFCTSGVLLLMAGLIAAFVSNQIRNQVVRALAEAEERRRAEVKARNTLIFGLAKLAEYRDTDTGLHVERIAFYSALLAGHLCPRFPHINEAWIETLRVAATMHDIGKVGVPDGVLLKPGRLTPEERGIIQTHPGIGADTLAAIRERHGEDALLEMSVDIAVGHHERWDGKLLK